MSWKEQAETEEELKHYVRALVKLELEKMAKEMAKKTAQKSDCKLRDLLKFMNSYEEASKGNLAKKK